MKKLIRLAKHEETQLELRTPRVKVHPNAQKLIDEIHARVEEGELEATRNYLIGIIETHGKDYGKDSWAKPAVDEAREQLEMLKDIPEPSGESYPSAESATQEAAA